MTGHAVTSDSAGEPGLAEPHTHGRAEETRVIRERLDRLGDGSGSAVWIEGGPGTGKSGLLAACLPDVTRRGFQLGWVVADRDSGRTPLELMLRCLGAEPADPSPGALLRGMTDLLELVEKACADSPLVLVVDDFQYADEASVWFWHRLRGATTRLPLLIIAAARPTPSRPDVTQARQVMEHPPGVVLRLGPDGEP